MRTVLGPLIFFCTLTACRTDKSPFEDDEGIIPPFSDDEDGDGYPSDQDCNDLDAVIYPGAEEICDGIDNNCDGAIDEGVTTTYFEDDDGDGFGNPDQRNDACQISDGWVITGNDCDDTDDGTYPGAAERCDDIDNDCDGAIDEEVNSEWFADTDDDGFGDPENWVEECDPPSGYVSNASDCDDNAPSAYPGATEICDDIDNDCDGETDEGLTTLWYEDADSDNWGNIDSTVDACDAPDGYVLLAGDCDDGNLNVSPSANEICNDIDDDCDGDIDVDAIDEPNWYADSDGDGFGNDDAETRSCDAPSGYVSDNSDCDDSNPDVSPAASEICNDIDDDCDGAIDDNDADVLDASTWYIDYDSDGFGTDWMTQSACENPSGYVEDNSDCDDTDADIYPGAEERCNGEDDDCDGDTDEESEEFDIWYADTDGDGFGDADTTTSLRSPPDTSKMTLIATITTQISIPTPMNSVSVDDNCDSMVDEGLLGLESDCAAADCLEIIESDYTVGDGSYWLDLDGTATEMECDMSTDGGGWTLIFSDDFEGTPDSGWSITDDDGSAVTVSTTTCGSWGSILGGYEIIAGGEIDITLDAFAIEHTEAWIALDYLSIDSWDNEAMYMDVDGTNIWAEAQNNHSSVYGEVCGWDRGYYGSYDSLEPVSEFLSHSDSEMEIVVGSTLDQSASDESFGIDNVEVWIR